jgi:uncharacterized protein (DUF1501 family)
MHLTRRFFMQTSGALAAYLGIAPAEALGATRWPSASHVTKGKTLVVIFLRGGADGLNLVIPHGDEHYRRLRRSIAIAQPGTPEGALDLDGKFGLHPRLAPLVPLFESGNAIAAHAVGYDKNTRSHFEEQDVWETGVVGNTVNSDGWLNRHLATSEGHGPVRAVSIGATLPRILHGKAPAYALRGMEDLALPDARGLDPARISAALEHAYCTSPDSHRSAASDLLADTAATTLDGIEQLQGLAGVPYSPRAAYPSTPLAEKLMQVARLIKADVGLEVAEVDLDGWDTHAGQGAAGGAFANLAGELAGAVGAFTADLEGRMDDVVVVTLTDFGRTAAENGSGGTDHGWANCMLIAGGPVARGSAVAVGGGPSRKVLTDWPGLAPDQLHDGRDLRHTTDFRDVLAELVGVHLGNPNLGAILPNHQVRPVGLIA